MSRYSPHTDADEEPTKPEEADDAIFVGRYTTVDDVKDFVRRRVESPTIVNGKTIWNFSSYELADEAIHNAAHHKLNQDKYYVPYQVTGTWGFMFALLPEEVQRAEILVYDVSGERYKAYNNFMQKISREQREAFTQDLARRVADIDL